MNKPAYTSMTIVAGGLLVLTDFLEKQGVFAGMSPAIVQLIQALEAFAAVYGARRAMG